MGCGDKSRENSKEETGQFMPSQWVTWQGMWYRCKNIGDGGSLFSQYSKDVSWE